MTTPSWLRARPDGVAILVKVVPGASRSRVAGVLGDRLKVQVAAPPEAGKANAALCRLIAELCGVASSTVRVSDGTTQPRKTVLLQGATAATVAARLLAVTSGQDG